MFASACVLENWGRLLLRAEGGSSLGIRGDTPCWSMLNLAFFFSFLFT